MNQGDTVEAEVVDVRDNGLYIRAEGLDGFLNIIELGWEPGPVHPTDFAEIGQTIAVYVYAVTETGFYASLRALDPSGDPFRDLSLYQPGARHRGRVWGLRTYGVFVRLESGAVGLVATHGKQPTHTIGDRMEVEVVSFAAATKQLALRLA
jgi:ribosomal protein S1